MTQSTWLIEQILLAALTLPFELALPVELGLLVERACLIEQIWQSEIEMIEVVEPTMDF